MLLPVKNGQLILTCKCTYYTQGLTVFDFLSALDRPWEGDQHFDWFWPLQSQKGLRWHQSTRHVKKQPWCGNTALVKWFYWPSFWSSLCSQIWRDLRWSHPLRLPLVVPPVQDVFSLLQPYVLCTKAHFSINIITRITQTTIRQMDTFQSCAV